MADIEERSSLWNFGATAAIVGGVGYGLYRAAPDIRAALATSQGTDIAASVASELRTLGRFNVGAANTSAFYPEVGESVLAGLRDSAANMIGVNEANTRVKLDLANATYESILAGGYSTHTQAYAAFQKVKNQTSIHDSYEEAKRNISSFKGSPDVLTSRMGEIGPGGFYPESRLSEMHKAAIIQEGMFSGGTIARQPMAKLSEDIEQEAIAAKERIGKAVSQSGGAVKWKGVYSIDDTLAGRKVTTPILQGSIGGELINIPLKDTGLTYGGENLTARYMTRTPYDEFLNLGSYRDQYLNTLENAIASESTSVGATRSVHKANLAILDQFHNDKSISESLAIWKMPESMMTAGGRAKARINALEASYVGGGKVTDQFIQDVVGATMAGKASLWPYGSPDAVSAGTFSKTNLAEALYGDLGRFKPVEKRPTQFIREQFGVTARAKAAAPKFSGLFGNYFDRLDFKTKGPGYKDIVYGGLDPLAAEAYSSPQLFTLYAKPSTFETGGVLSNLISEEESLISENASRFMEYERTVQKRINLSGGMSAHQDIVSALKDKKIGQLVEFSGNPLGVDRGGFLGIEAGTGKEIWGEGARGADARLIGAQLIDDNTANLYLKETHTLGDEYWKFFNEDVKFMGHVAPQSKISAIASALGQKSRIVGQEVEQIVSGKMLQKDFSALMNQQIAAVSAIASRKITNKDKMITVRRRKIATEFMENPIGYLGVKDTLNMGLQEAQEQVQRNMISLANTLGFNEQEMGLTFGLMKESMAEKFGIKEAVSKTNVVIGLSGLKLGDFAFEGGAGGRASIEQTGLRLLSMQGDTGLRAAAELGTRIRGKNELIPIDRMLESLMNERPLVDKVKDVLSSDKLESLKDIASEQLIKPEGRYVSVGSKLSALGGSDRIYIPGLSEAESSMGHYITEKGDRIRSPITGALSSLHKLVKSGADKKELEEAAAILRNQVASASQQQAAGRGKVIGSKLLTAIRRNDPSDVFGVSKSDAARMMDDLIERAQGNQSEFLRQQKEQLLSGEAISGMVWRHPTTGPESIQFRKYAIDPDLKPGMVRVPYKKGTIDISDIGPRNVDIGPAIGMKLDYDKDMLAIAAISDKGTYDRAAKRISSSLDEDYNKFLFRHHAIGSILKENQVIVEDDVDFMLQGARNLTTAKIATPQVNIALQKAKLGLQINQPQNYRPLADLLFHLEESAISGKHGARSAELYTQIADAFNNSDATKIETVLNDLGLSERTVQGTIKDASGNIIANESFEIKTKEWSKQLADATRATGKDVDRIVTAAQISKGTIEPQNLNEIIEMHYRRKTGSLDVAQAVMHSQVYESNASERINRALRRGEGKLSALKGALGKAKAPAMIGATIAAGILMASPAISGQLPNQTIAGGKNLSPNDLGPPTGLNMDPPAHSIMQSPRVYDINRIQTASRASIRMPMRDANASNESFMKQARTLAQNGNVRVRTVDDRNNLDPQRLANKIYERL